MRDEVHLSVAEATRLGERALRAIGFNAEESRVTAAHLVDAELCGCPHLGLARVLTIHEDPRSREPRTPIRIVYQTKVSALLDGGNHVGYYAVHRATKLAVAKARKNRIAVVGLYRSYLSGRNSYYLEMIARAGLVGIHLASALPVVLPHGGARPVFGTNPIGFGFPTGGDPFIVDLGTAATTRGDVILRSRLGVPLPEGIAIDARGEPTTDPAAALKGGIFAFGGHRGSALSFGIQAMCLLAGAARPRGKVQDYAFLFVVFDPAILMPAAEFKRQVRELIEVVRAVPPLDPEVPVRIPSEKSFRERARQRKEGIDVDRAVYDRLRALSAQRRPALRGAGRAG
ncbi:MAG TPA: Ldh family oxidoreductase [Burkholderiales bacterium]|nr:Ldh family oxidoreductase [Burkholderiales bacterium]